MDENWVSGKLPDLGELTFWPEDIPPPGVDPDMRQPESDPGESRAKRGSPLVQPMPAPEDAPPADPRERCVLGVLPVEGWVAYEHAVGLGSRALALANLIPEHVRDRSAVSRGVLLQLAGSRRIIALDGRIRCAVASDKLPFRRW